ncbi:MAG: FAD-binding protein [Burkholderiales bacterium]
MNDRRANHEREADIETDVLVVGYGAAGAAAAIEARACGQQVLLVEKMADPGGLSILSAGGIRIAFDEGAALDYLVATCGERTPRPVLQALARGMTEVAPWIESLAARIDARVSVTRAAGNYPYPGFDSLGYCEVTDVPRLAGKRELHAASVVNGGARLFDVLDANVRASGAVVRMSAAARRLVVEHGEIAGADVEWDGAMHRVRARKGVILACGGFEAAEEMKRQYFEATPVLAGSFLGNTGDGIAMAQKVGAALWHMWHYHGPYGMRHPDPAFPYAFYMKALPMWTPGTDTMSTLGVADAAGRDTLPRMAWIVVDQDGRRFMDEYPPYPGDTGCRPFEVFDFHRQRFPRIPAFLLFDEDGRRMYPMGRQAINDRGFRYAWSADNAKEIELGFFERADSLAELARKLGLDADALASTVSRWNVAVEEGVDRDFGRRPETMVPLRTPPFYAAKVYPVVINTQGGPRHNEFQQVVDPFDAPIPRLYVAGELGSVFGHVYMSGGNLAECIVGGRVAARHAAGLPDAER